MAVQNDNTLLCKGDLKAYHESIAPYLGGNLMVSTNVSDYYSEDEKIIGVWLDGKPLYQKTYFTNDLENATTLQTKNISAGFPLSNRPERIVSTVGCWRVGSNPYTGGTIPYVDDNYVMNAQLSGSQGYIQILYKGDWRNTDVYITLQYTKTADTANSAVTTPGCYDINFPNTWPQNTEIFFGNGLYGQRITGTESLTANVRKDIRINNEECQLKAFGGWVKPDGGTWMINFPYYWNNENYISTAQIYSNIATSPYAGLMLFFKSNQTQTTIYDIWVTYTK